MKADAAVVDIVGMAARFASDGVSAVHEPLYHALRQEAVVISLAPSLGYQQLLAVSGEVCRIRHISIPASPLPRRGCTRCEAFPSSVASARRWLVFCSADTSPSTE